jgi:hypothetical protein
LIAGAPFLRAFALARAGGAARFVAFGATVRFAGFARFTDFLAFLAFGAGDLFALFEAFRAFFAIGTPPLTLWP